MLWCFVTGQSFPSGALFGGGGSFGGGVDDGPDDAGGGLFLAARCFYLGVVLYATAMLLANSFGISPWAGILVVGIVSTVYTYFGGMEAVTADDFLRWRL